MTAEATRHAASETVEAPLKYLASAADVPVYIPSVGGGDVTLHEGNYVMQTVPIHNGRARREPFSLDREGFVLVAQRSAVRDFYDDGEIASPYEAEVKALLQRVTGAARVEIFDHTRRSASLAVQKERTIREPASIIHNGRSGCATSSPTSRRRRSGCCSGASPSSTSGARSRERWRPRRWRSAMPPAWHRKT